jgi:hypothetical protein
MFAIAAAVFFALALLFQLAGIDLGQVVNVSTLTTAGFLCMALHMCGFATSRSFSRRRR